MSLKRTNTVLVALIGVTVIYFGANFLINPHGAAGGFGITPWPRGNATGYFTVKGVRDIASGLVVLTLLAMSQRRALGCVLLADALIPIGDATAVLTHGGPPVTAYGIHGTTAALVIMTGCLLLRETSAQAAEAVPRHAEAVSAVPVGQSTRSRG